MKREPQFATEADLCAAFIEWLRHFPGWTAYAETHGWDILLAHEDGTQIGIQAKLKFNMKVLAQTVEYSPGWSIKGPDFRAILVPDGADSAICSALGIGVIESARYEREVASFSPDLDAPPWRAAWHYHNPAQRLTLPRYVPDVPAGVSGPMLLSPWKIAALEIVATLRIRGHVTRADFKAAGIDYRRWTNIWLEPNGTAGQWRARADIPDFAAQHPVVWPQVFADVNDRLRTAA